MKIILVGAHGTGKSTIANLIQAKYGWPIIESASRDIKSLMDSGKIHITDQDYHELITMFNLKLWKDIQDGCQRQNYIFTRTLIDNISYSKDFSEDLNNNPLYQELIAGNRLKNSLIFHIPIEFELEDDGVRYTDKEYQKLIQERQEFILKKLVRDGVIKNWIEIAGTPYERLEQFEYIYGYNPVNVKDILSGYKDIL